MKLGSHHSGQTAKQKMKTPTGYYPNKGKTFLCLTKLKRNENYHQVNLCIVTTPPPCALSLEVAASACSLVALFLLSPRLTAHQQHELVLKVFFVCFFCTYSTTRAYTCITPLKH